MGGVLGLVVGLKLFDLAFERLQIPARLFERFKLAVALGDQFTRRFQLRLRRIEVRLRDKAPADLGRYLFVDLLGVVGAEDLLEPFKHSFRPFLRLPLSDYSDQSQHCGALFLFR